MPKRKKKKNKTSLAKFKAGHWLVIIILFGLTLRLNFFVGLNWNDDPGYVFDAYRISTGSFEPAYTNGLRSGMIYPVALFLKIFGVSNASITLYPLLCSLGSIILIFYFGKLLFNEKVGLLAAFLLSFYPLNIIYATWVMPDVPLAFFTGLSIFLFVIGNMTRGRFVIKQHKKYLKTRKVLRIKKSNVCFLLSGLFLGMGYLLKVTGLIPVLFFSLYVLFKRQVKLDYSFILVGFLIIFSMESIYTYSHSGDPFLRYHTITEYFTGKDVVREHGLNTDLKFYPRQMFSLNQGNRIIWDNKYNMNYGFFFYFVVLSLAYCFVKWEKRAFVPIIWLLVFFAYLEFGSMSLTHFQPIHRLFRHLTIITMPSILLLAHFLYDNMSRHIVRKSFSLLVIAFLLVTSIYYTYHKHEYLNASTYDVKAMYQFLKDEPKKQVYTDGGAIGHIQFYFGFERNMYMRAVYTETNCNRIKDAYVIINATRGWGEYAPFLRGLPTCLRNPPSHWKVVKTIRGPKIDVFQVFDPVIYYAPA